MRGVASHATPLRYLAELDVLHLLPQLFGHVVIPTAVQDELTHHHALIGCPLSMAIHSPLARAIIPIWEDIIMLQKHFLIKTCLVSLFLSIAPAGAFMSCPSQAAETVKIAAIFGKTSEGDAMSFINENSAFKGLRYAVKELNQQGGLLGKQIELFEFDNETTELGSRMAAQKAVKAGVIAVIGAAWSSNSLAMAPVFQQAKIPMISPVSTNPKVTQVGDYIFRVCFIDPFQGTVMANFAYDDLKATTAVVLINASSIYSMGLAQYFVPHFQAQGGEILWEGEYLDDTANFRTLLERIGQLEPDVVFIPDYDRRPGFIIKQAHNMGIHDVTFLGGDGWDNNMYEYGGRAVEGNYYSGHWHRAVTRNKSRQFVQQFEQQGEIDSTNIPLAYDAMYLLADAVQRADSVEPARIRDALAETSDFQGVTGAISFDQNGDPIKSAVILKFEQGTSVYFKTVEP